MSSMDRGGAPLLNDYKLEFFWKRLPQTILGGPKLRLGNGSRARAPYYVYFNQILIFFVPFILGGLLTVLAELDVVSPSSCGYIYGSLMFLFVLGLQLASWLIRRSANMAAKLQNNALAEDDEVEFVSCCGVETIQFIIPGKKFAVNMVLHALVSGCVCGLMLLYILPSNLNNLFSNTGATVVIFSLGWLAVCIAQYSLTAAPPPEPATFRALDSLEVAPLMRPFYVMAFGLVGVLASEYEELLPLDRALHILFPFLPLLWIVGILPPLDALLPWLAEQGLVMVMGGSPQATDLRLLLMFLMSSIVVAMVTFIPSHLATMIIAAAFGYILSCDIFGLIKQVRGKLASREGAVMHHWGWRELLIHAVMLVLCTTVVGVSFEFSANGSKELFDGLCCVFIALLVVIKVTGDFQGVYVLFGLLRNPFYPATIENLDAFKKRKRFLKYVGLVRHLVLVYASPLCLVAFLGLFLAPDKLLSLSSFAIALGTTRALRQAWQSTFACLLDVTLLYICTEALGTGAPEWWTGAGLGLQLMLISACRDRAQQLLTKLSFMATLTVTAWTQPKQHHRLTAPILVTSAVFFPVVLGILSVATVLSAPLLPLFCLPVFLVGFPRPLRSWPRTASTAASVCQDTVYYRQLAPHVVSTLGVTMATGAAGSPRAGDHFLARFQDRMIWVQVLECGYRFSTVVIKGLELQETSCHTVEAARVDDVFEAALSRDGKWPVVSVNAHAGNVLRPCDALLLDTYSDANNVLTGVIDQPDNLRKTSENFWKTLVWVLVHHCKDRPREAPDSEGVPAVVSGKKGGEETVVSGLERKNVEDSEPQAGEGDQSTATKPERFLQRIPSHDDMELTLLVKREPHAESNRVGPLEPAAAGGGGLRRAGSLPSLSDSVWSQESLNLSGFSTKKPGNDTEVKLGGFPAENEDVFGLGGFPAVDIGQSPVFSGGAAQSGFGGNPPNARPVSVAFSTKHAHLIDLPSRWRDFTALDRRQIDAVIAQFPEAWYRHVLASLEFATHDVNHELASDQALTGLYRHLVCACYVLVEVLGFPGSSSVQAGPGHVFKVFSGELPWSLSLDWLERDSELKSLVLKAYRYAFKLTYDEAVLGEVTSADELADYLTEYDRDWYMGSDQSDDWQRAVMHDRPALFSIGKHNDKGTYTSRVLTKQSIVTPLGRLNSECVRAQWASLALELLYFTNDDEERYSIQAHPTLLRNLNIQAADPPLGYPVYSSGAVSVPVHVTPL